MKKTRRFLSLEIVLADLLQFLHDKGCTGDLPFPDDLRVVAARFAPEGVPPDYLRITLESDSLPETYCYRGFMHLEKVDLRQERRLPPPGLVTEDPPA